MEVIGALMHGPPAPPPRGTGNNQAASTVAASSFLNNDAPLWGSGRGGQRPRNGLSV